MNRAGVVPEGVATRARLLNHAPRCQRVGAELIVPHVIVDGSNKSPLDLGFGARHEWFASPTFTRKTHKGFISPNELNPERAAALYGKAPPGKLHVAVGTVRGFIGAYLSQAGALLLTDQNPNVIAYNHIESGLLQMAHYADPSHYRYLRFHADFSDWRALFHRLAHNETARLISDPAAWQWWVQQVRIDRATLFSVLNDGIDDYGHEYFVGVNYLYSADVLTALQLLAKNGRIDVICMNYVEREDLAALAGLIDGMGYLLGVMDVSNAWESHHYIGYDGASQIFSDLRSVATRESKMIGTCLGKSDTFYFAVDFGEMWDLANEQERVKFFENVDTESFFERIDARDR